MSKCPECGRDGDHLVKCPQVEREVLCIKHGCAGLWLIVVCGWAAWMFYSNWNPVFLKPRPKSPEGWVVNGPGSTRAATQGDMSAKAFKEEALPMVGVLIVIGGGGLLGFGLIVSAIVHCFKPPQPKGLQASSNEKQIPPT